MFSSEKEICFSDEGPSLKTLEFLEINHGSYQPLNLLPYLMQSAQYPIFNSKSLIYAWRTIRFSCSSTSLVILDTFTLKIQDWNDKHSANTYHMLSRFRNHIPYLPCSSTRCLNNKLMAETTCISYRRCKLNAFSIYFSSKSKNE